jgi:hypothetical protein
MSVDVSIKYKKARDKHRIIQAILSHHRQWAVNRFSEILPKRYVENRYKKREHRNKFEIDRVWDDKLQLTFDYIKELLSDVPSLRNVPALILISRYSQLNKFNDIHDHLCDEIIANHFNTNRLKRELGDSAAESKLEREHHFLSLLFELLDKAETEYINAD